MRLCGRLDKADQSTTSVHNVRLILLVIAANSLAHPAGPPFSRKNDPRSVHVLRSRQAYCKARVQRLRVLISAVEVASMSTLNGVGAVLVAEPEQFGDESSCLFACLVRLS